MAHTRKKVFVLDTNVILHDSKCLYNLQEHDVIVPITVLEELDQFKKGNETIHYHAREFVRALDVLSGKELFNGGVRIAPYKGKVMIRLERELHKDLELNYAAPKPDHRILNLSYYLAEEFAPRKVILLTKDVTLRMKAKSVGLMAADYTNDHVRDISVLDSNSRLEENVPETVVDMLYNAPFEIDHDLFPLAGPPLPNEYMVLRNCRKSVLAVFDANKNSIRKVEKVPAYGIVPRNAEQTFALNALMNPDIPLVSISGKAGTGKTLLALAAALAMKKQYHQIFLARPIVPLSNKDIGYLPGDIQSKIAPYMQPLYDNLGVIQNQFPENDKKNSCIKQFLEKQKLVISPLAYIRGRSQVKTYFIVDEAQNLTPHELKTIITRAGEGTKVVFTGDIFQIDHPYLDSHSNGLSYFMKKMQGQHVYAHINLKKGERSKLSELASNLL